MSAANPSISDREYEALRRAQKAHEPSMEEILASIRSIIAEERSPAKPFEPKNSAKAAAPVSPQVVYSRPDAPLRAPVASPERAEPSPAANSPGDVERQPERALSGCEESGPLLSAETDRAVASAFDSLSANVAARSADLAEQAAREMLRPMLKTWLDENLPGIVERLVSAEIERVVKGTR